MIDIQSSPPVVFIFALNVPQSSVKWDVEELEAESRARVLLVARLTRIHCNLSTASLLTRPNCSEVFFPGAVVVRATTRDIRARLTQHSPRGGSLSQGYVQLYMEGEPFVRRPSVHSSTLPIEPLPAVRVHGTMSHKPGIKIGFRLLTLSWILCHPPVSLNCCRSLAKKWKCRNTTSLKPW